MTENGVSPPQLHSVPFHEPRPCPPSTPCGAPVRPRERKPYEPHQLSNNEARLLTEAVRAAEDEIERGMGDAAAVVGLARRTRLGAGAAVTRVELVVAEAAAARGRVAAVHARHRWDGAENRLVRRRWVGVVMWAATVAAACYDTAFFAAMFLSMLDRPWSWADPVSYAALLPGLLIAAALLLCGQGLAQAVARSRAHWERKPLRKRLFGRLDPELRRGVDDLPWPNWFVPLAFLVFLLVTVGIWAVIRAEDLVYVDPLVQYAFVLLLLLFNLTCVGLKVLHHNPYMESKNLVDTTLAEVTKRERQAVEVATAKLAECTEAVYALRAVLDRLTVLGRRKVDEAWEVILRDRDGHGLAGDLAPSFASGGKLRFAGVVVPHVQVESLDKARTLADDLDPSDVQRRLAAALGDVTEEEPNEPAEEQTEES